MKNFLLVSIAAILAISLNAQQKGTFTDSRDGKTYKTVKIGNQVWMAENLAYNPGNGNYWVYDNKSSNSARYGYLYDWQTALNVCPAGWHLPSDEEWTELTNFVGGNAVTKLKAKSGWSSNGNGTDDYGFSALPGGYRYYRHYGYGGPFSDIGLHGYWWSATDTGYFNAWYRVMYCNFSTIFRDFRFRDLGFSVRCVKD